MMKTEKNHSSGMSLLESLLAIIIVAVSTTYLLLSTQAASTGNNRSSKQRLAASLTQESLDKVRFMTLQELDSWSNGDIISKNMNTFVKLSVKNIVPNDIRNFDWELNETSLRKIELETIYPSEDGGTIQRSQVAIINVQ